MRPYYDCDGVTIFCGDCRDVMPNLIADVVVTDPPFGIRDTPFTTLGRTGKRCGAVNDWHPPSTWDWELDPAWITDALRFGPVALFGHWRQRIAFETAAGLAARAEIIWAKDTHVGPPRPAAMQDERIWIFSRGPFRPQRFETTIWAMPIIPTWAHRLHKNEKPESLMVRLLSWMPAGIVLDPFMGSGTTLVAAKRSGRRAIGIDINARYCDIAAARLAQRALPLLDTGTHGRP